MLVKLSSIRLERPRDFGDAWLAWGLWRMLGLDDFFEQRIERGREDVSWGTMATILTIARFCEPASELHIADTWYRRTALEELLGVTPEQIHTTRLYDALDQLLPHKDALETHVRQRLGELFELKCDLLLYDVTSTYFEGEMEGCPLAQRGYSRDSRGDRPQVCIGLVVTEDGFPLGYEVFAGNTHDSRTVKTIIEAMEKKHGTLNRVWVMDRGMVSEENLKYLRERGGKYIVGTPKAMLRQFEQYLTEADWTEAQEGVEVKLVPGPDGEETFILTRSADRRAKEQAMHEKFTARLEEGLKKMQTAATTGRLKDEAAAGERLGRLKQQNWRGAGLRGLNQETGPTAWQAAIGNHLATSSQVRRLVATRRWLLSTAEQSHGHRCGDAVEAVHPAHGSGVGLPHHQGRIGDSAHLAPQGKPREGAHLGLLLGLCVMENAGGLDAKCWSGRCPADCG